jgi:hypothetical protein
MWSCTTFFFPCRYNSGNIIARSEQRMCTPGEQKCGKTNMVLFVETKILVYDKHRAINILRNINIVLLFFSKKYYGEVKMNK